MTELSLIGLLKDWLIPLGSVVMSVWFAASAKKDADRADLLLAQIRDSVEGSQRKMIESATGILDSLPQVIEGKASLAKMQAANAVIETIRMNISNPGRAPAAEHDQQMLALSAHLSMLIAK
jgi:hypothetical protein